MKFKKVFLCIICIISFFILAYNVSASESRKPITITITTYFDEDNIITNKLEGEFYYGSKISLADRLADNPDYQFAFWIVDGMVRYDYKLNHEFILTDNMDITAIFKPVGMNAVVFMAANGKLIDVQYVLPGGDAVEPDISKLPQIPGYVLKGNKWDKPLTNIVKDTVITLQYEKESKEEYLLVINDGVIKDTNKSSAYIPYNDIVTIVSNPHPDGKTFAYWMIDDYIVSYKSTYSFTILTDVNIVAIYRDTPVEEKPLITISKELGLVSAKKTYAGQFYLPEGYELIEFGILTSSNTGVINLDTPNVKKYKGLSYLPYTNEFLFSFSDSSIKSVRGYLIYKDHNGHIYTIYNEKVMDTPGETRTILTENAENTPANSLSSKGWAINGVTTNSKDKAWALESKNTWMKTPLLDTTSGKITITMTAWATGNVATNTFVIEGLDENHQVVDTTGPIKVGIDGANILNQYKEYKEVSFTLDNINQNIKYLRLTYNKENDDTNLRIKNIIITQEGSVKTIERISATLGKSEYLLDQPIDLSNSSLVIYHTDGTYSRTTLTEDMVSGFDTSSYENNTATVTYLGHTCELKYHVINTPIIIYEVYGGGGNANAIYNSDYVVLYNTTNQDIDLSEYSLQYSSYNNNNYSVLKLSGIIYNNSYYLIKLASTNNPVGNNLPIEPSFVGNTNLAQDRGKIALVKSLSAISSINDPNVVDFIGYGSATTEFEKQPTSNLSSTLSAKRTSFIDNNHNKNDFSVGKPDLSYLLDKSIRGISLNNINTYYNVYDELYLDNASIYVHYSNGTKELVYIINDMISGFSTTKTGDYIMTITYEQFKLNVKYTVYDDSNEVYVFFIDIGESGGQPGEAALIKIGNIEILIDAGDNGNKSVYELLDFLNDYIYDNTIEYVIATHPDSDHIGGMFAVYEAYFIENTILYSTTGDGSALRQSFESIVYSEGSNIYYVYDLIINDPVLEIIEGVNLTFYDTGYLTSNNTNDSSIVFVLNAFDTRILFTGDSEQEQEANYASLVGDVDILKVGHHGSKNGTSTTLLEYVKPEIAIINNGDYLGNKYHHPTYETLARLYDYNYNIQVYAVTGGNGSDSDYMLDRNGDITITITTNGYYITSKYYGDNPIEMRYTHYYRSLFDLEYYNGITHDLVGEALKQALHNLIDNHISISYDKVKDAFLITEEDPNNPNNVLLFYTGRSQGKDTFGTGANDYNREHIWPNSHGIYEKGPMYTDLHHLRATDVSVNNLRGNLDFGYVANIPSNIAGSISEYGDVLSYCYVDGVYFEVRDEIKGDVARMLFYMAVRYEGDEGEPDLELVNGTTCNGTNYLGNLAVLIEWHLLDPVDDFERSRNDKVYAIQGNRNPFIDYPEYAIKIFGLEN